MVEARKGKEIAKEEEEEKVLKGRVIAQVKVLTLFEYRAKSSFTSSLFAAKLYNGEIMIFDKELNIQKRIKSSIVPNIVEFID